MTETVGVIGGPFAALRVDRTTKDGRTKFNLVPQDGVDAEGILSFCAAVVEELLSLQAKVERLEAGHG